MPIFNWSLIHRLQQTGEMDDGEEEEGKEE